MVWVLAGTAELAALAAVGVWRARLRGAAQRQRRMFAEAADEARRLAFQARIADARRAELWELMIEQALPALDGEAAGETA